MLNIEIEIINNEDSFGSNSWKKPNCSHKPPAKSKI